MANADCQLLRRRLVSVLHEARLRILQRRFRSFPLSRSGLQHPKSVLLCSEQIQSPKCTILEISLRQFQVVCAFDDLLGRALDASVLCAHCTHVRPGKSHRNNSELLSAYNDRTFSGVRLPRL